MEDHERVGSPSSSGGIDTLQWIAGVAKEADMNILGGSPPLSSYSSAASRSVDSLSVKSQMLEAYPALLSYAVNEFFNHARLAQNSGANLTPIFTRLHEDRTWNRWLALSEDEFADPDFDRYLSKEEFIRYDGEKQEDKAGTNYARFSRRLRSQGSVKSFRSAASSTSSSSYKG